MAKFSKELMNKLSEFMVSELGSKTIDGVTYAMVLRDEKDKDRYDRMLSIKEEALKCGFRGDEVFRINEVSNGYIVDMDLGTAKQITRELGKAVGNANNEKIDLDRLIGNKPEQRREKDMMRLARNVKSDFEKGKVRYEIALYNRNSTDSISVIAKGVSNEKLQIKYRAYALSYLDIERVNRKYLMKEGLRISRLQPCEILPSRNGVSFIIDVEEV